MSNDSRKRSKHLWFLFHRISEDDMNVTVLREERQVMAIACAKKSGLWCAKIKKAKSY